LLKEAGGQRVIDIRLNNTSQLAGFAKKEDLAYILSLVGIGYVHLPALAPTEDILRNFNEKKLSRADYEEEFLRLLKERGALVLWGSGISPNEVNCLLCSEDKPDQCHRRLVAEYFAAADPSITVRHLI